MKRQSLKFGGPLRRAQGSGASRLKTAPSCLRSQLQKPFRDQPINSRLCWWPTWADGPAIAGGQNMLRLSFPPLTHLLLLQHDPQNLSEIMNSIPEVCTDEQNKCGFLGPNVYCIRGIREYRCPDCRSTLLPAQKFMIFSHCAKHLNQPALVIWPSSVTQSLVNEFKETLCKCFLVYVFCVGFVLFCL